MAPYPFQPPNPFGNAPAFRGVGARRRCPEELTGSWGVHSARRNRFVQVNIPVANLYVEAAGWVNADPSLVVNRGTLSTVIRQGNQLPPLATLTLWQRPVFHGTPSLSSITPSITSGLSLFKGKYRLVKPHFAARTETLLLAPIPWEAKSRDTNSIGIHHVSTLGQAQGERVVYRSW